MILYTTMPLKTVLQGLENFAPTYVEVEIKGVKVLVEPVGLKEGRIVRLLSTNPQDFLDPALQPGRIISLVPASG